MKIGIITFWWSRDNYGQILQAYALSQYLRELGHSPVVIKYIPAKVSFIKRVIAFFKLNRNSLSIKKLLLQVRKTYAFATQKKNVFYSHDQRKFEEFRNQYIAFTKDTYHSLKELKKEFFEFDVLICGSDKIWSSVIHHIENYDSLDIYSLAFYKKKIVKIAYAPSIGSSVIDISSGNHLATNLKDFKGVSIRENSGVQLLNSLGITNVTWVPDPSLVCDKQEYIQLIERKADLFRKEWFVYGLRNPSLISGYEIVKKFREHNLDYAYASGNNYSDEFINCYPTINEWLSYIYYSKNIITNSYHGCIFCIIFEKNFFYYPVNPLSDGSTDERITSLLKRLKITNRAISNIDTLAKVLINPESYKINWREVNMEVNIFAQEGRNFLMDHLRGTIDPR